MKTWLSSLRPATKSFIIKGLFVCFSFVPLQVFSQHFTTSIGMGLGGKVEDKFPDCSNASNKGRVMGQITQSYSVNKYYRFGIQAILSGRLSSMVGAASGSCQTYEPGTNTTTISGNNLSANSVLFRNRLLFSPERKLSFYIDAGLGFTTYSYGSITADKGTVRKTSFAVSPQLGVTLKRFDIAAIAILGGRTPAFAGYDTFSKTNVSLSSIKSQQFYLTFSYDVFRF